MPWSVTYVSPLTCERDRSRARSGPPRSPGAASWCERTAELVELGARDLPLVGDHLAPRCPAARGCSAPSARGGHGEPTSSTQLEADAHRDVAHVLDARRRSTTSWTPEAISAAAKLTACWAEPHWRSTVVAGVSIGSPACSQALRPTLKHLLAVLLHAAGDDVLDLGGVDPGALDDLGVGLARAARSGACPCSSPSRGGRARSGVRTASTMTTSRPAGCSWLSLRLIGLYVLR